VLNEISRLTDLLFLSGLPDAKDRDKILGLNIHLILCMHWIRPVQALYSPPLRLVWLPTLDSPLAPISIHTLQRGVNHALPVMLEEHGVLVHCKYGVHRSVAMACCILVAMGYCAESAMRLAKEARMVADPDAPYIKNRILSFEDSWNLKNHQSL
jgi:protein-tyrosine phosphatase